MEKSRQVVHAEDTLQIHDLQKSLEAHCKQNIARDLVLDERDAKTENKLDQLMWLADEDFKATLKVIIEDRKANTIIAAKIIKWIGVIGAILGLVWGGIQIWRAIK